MRTAALLFTLVAASASLCAQKQAAHSTRILDAKTVYFLDKTESHEVGAAALAELKKWGKYKIVSSPKEADLVLLLSADPFRDGDILFASGQTGSMNADGRVVTDPVPNYTRAAPTRSAYLTVIDAKTDEKLWSAEHVWGGLLTGYNTAGVRLVRKLEHQTRK